jgi:hypothetical protein
MNQICCVYTFPRLRKKEPKIFAQVLLSFALVYSPLFALVYYIYVQLAYKSAYIHIDSNRDCTVIQTAQLNQFSLFFTPSLSSAVSLP